MAETKVLCLYDKWVYESKFERGYCSFDKEPKKPIGDVEVQALEDAKWQW